jgi:hypothetical protein
MTSLKIPFFEIHSKVCLEQRRPHHGVETKETCGDAVATKVVPLLSTAVRLQNLKDRMTSIHWPKYLICVAALLAIAGKCQAFVPTKTNSLWKPHQLQANSHASQSPLILHSKKENNDDDLRRNFYEREAESSKKAMTNLLTFQGVGSAIVTAGWTFVVIGLILPLFGYDYVVRDGRLTIDTVEARQFQNEVNRATTGSTKKSAAPSTRIESPVSNLGKVDE